MRGHEREDCTTDMGKTLSGCGEWNEKGANRPKEGEGSGQGKLGGMGMMGGWMEAGAHLGVGVKLTTGFPSNACWGDWDVQWRFGDG
jgi:hypothetical protein